MYTRVGHSKNLEPHYGNVQYMTFVMYKVPFLCKMDLRISTGKVRSYHIKLSYLPPVCKSKKT